MHRRIGWAARGLVLAVLLFSGLWTVAAARPVRPGSERPVVVSVPAGAGSVAIGRLLVAHGLVRNAYLFAAIAKLSGEGARLQAGEYRLTPGMTLEQIVAHLSSGDVIVVRVTIPPGFDVAQVIARLVQSGLGRGAAFAAAARDWTLVRGLAPVQPAVRWPVEGFLYPDTYDFTHSMTPRAILATMVAEFRRAWTPAMAAAAAREHLSTLQVVTLASLVEREARSDSERPAIAGVFFNRLRQGMPLDSDPTVDYALGGAPAGPLTVADLRLDSPYNTYAHPGLPVGPIANPGPASLQAALHPAQVPYLYFITKPDGTPVFATTLAGQLANRKRYLGY